jgi:hypothetical protein
MFRPSIPYFGFQQPMVPPQMPPQQMQGMQPGQPQAGMVHPLGMQMNPQLLAQLAQLRGMGLGGAGAPQMPMFGRPAMQPGASGAYSLR